ncbi:MAG TPA: anthranilate phosphoribosyltransferase [Dehalococcoidia bacterium]|jgi:anthranilate phosphoribosyltransferase|nr:anthranilate phosphoribosyltransferase [Dehalococcoidia bacterium]
MTIRDAITALVNERRDLTRDEAAGAMREIFDGQATPAQLGAFVVALRLKGETVDEIAGMAGVMRERALRVTVDGPLLDTCGTGGDDRGTFNVSTAAAFVAAGAGVRIAKHGNRAMTSGCGSADVLEALGAKIDLGPEQVAECIEKTGFGFMFAQAFHPAMKHAAGPRREIGVHTVFNILGPLTNPAGAQHQLLGVARADMAPKMAAAFQLLDGKHALIVHGNDGIDELSISGPSSVHEIRNGGISEYTVSPADAGVPVAAAEAIRGGDPEQNAALLVAIMKGEQGPARDVVLLNAAAALLAADAAGDLKEGAAIAEDTIDSGAAAQKLEAWVEATRSFA